MNEKTNPHMRLLGVSLVLFVAAFLTGCTVTGVGRDYRLPDSSRRLYINADVNSMSFKGHVYVNNQMLFTHQFPMLNPFANSTKEKVTVYHGHKIRAVFKCVSNYNGTATVSIFVFVDGDLAADFYF
jgi:hypothetical protein